MKTKITLEDNGQDFLEFICNDDGVIVETFPFQGDIWNGGVIPIKNSEMCKVGGFCPMHNPPHIKYGYLKHKIAKIENVGDIVARLEEVLGVSLRQRTRKREVAYARFICYKYLKEYRGYSFQKIADLFGFQSHASIIHGVNAVNGLLQNEDPIAQKYWDDVTTKWKRGNEKRTR